MNKYLVDECLTTDLVAIARARADGTSTHVAWIGKAGMKDWELIRIIEAGDWTFVTKNSADFRGPADRTGSNGQYTRVAIHAGLICLDSIRNLTIEEQCEVFEAVLEYLGKDDDLVNKVVNVFVGDDDTAIKIEEFPKGA